MILRNGTPLPMTLQLQMLQFLGHLWTAQIDGRLTILTEILEPQIGRHVTKIHSRETVFFVKNDNACVLTHVI